MPVISRGCFTNTFVINYFIHCLGHLFPPTNLRHRHVQTVRDSVSSYKIDYIQLVNTYLNHGQYQMASLVQKLWRICWMWGLSILVEFHREGSAPAACKAGLFNKSLWIIVEISIYIIHLVFTLRGKYESYITKPSKKPIKDSLLYIY